MNVYLNGNCIAPTVAEWSKTSHGKRYLKGERLPLDKKFKKGTVGWVRQQFIGKYDKAIDLVNAPVQKLHTWHTSISYKIRMISHT